MGFFANLATSLREPTRLVRPRLPSIFEPPSWHRSKALEIPDDALETQAFSETTELANVTRESSRIQPSQPAVEIQPKPVARASRVAPTVSLRDPVPEAARKPSTVQGSHEDSEAVVPSVQRARPRGAANAVHGEPTEVQARVDPSPLSKPALHPPVEEAVTVRSSPMRAAASSPPALRIDRTPDESAARAISAIEPRINVPKQTELAPPVVARLRAAPEIPRRHSIGKPTETTVHVSIGRVEVRAAPAPPQRRRSAEKPPVMALDEYLRSRAEGRR